MSEKLIACGQISSSSSRGDHHASVVVVLGCSGSLPTRMYLVTSWKHLRKKHRLPVVTSEDARMRSASDKQVFAYCTRKALILVSFNVKDFWRVPLRQSWGMFLIDVDKARSGSVLSALDMFFAHNGRIGRFRYIYSMFRLTTQGYVMKYQLYPNPEVHQVEARYMGKRVFADFMAFP
jgi:hypothetical protein